MSNNNNLSVTIDAAKISDNQYMRNILNKVNIGRYFLDVINNNIIRRKKKFFIKI